MTEQDTKPTNVIFRKWKDSTDFGGDITALMPGEPSSCVDRYEIGCYDSSCGHSGADYQFMLSITVPATPEEYANIKADMERIGYRVRVLKRAQHCHFHYNTNGSLAESAILASQE